MKEKISKSNIILESDYISIQDFVSFTSPVSSFITALAICKKSCPIKFFLPPVTTSAKLTPSISTAAAYRGFISLYSPIDCTPQLPICGAPNLNNSSSSIIVFSAPVSITASTSSDLLLTEIIAFLTISINTDYIDEVINLEWHDYRKTLSAIPLKVTATGDEKIVKLTFNQSLSTATIDKSVDNVYTCSRCENSRCTDDRYTLTGSLSDGETNVSNNNFVMPRNGMVCHDLGNDNYYYQR